MPAIIKLALIIAQILIERITGHRFAKWADGTMKGNRNETSKKI